MLPSESVLASVKEQATPTVQVGAVKAAVGAALSGPLPSSPPHAAVAAVIAAAKA
jgi:hypothetical protein